MARPLPQEKEYITVSDLTRLLNTTLEMAVPRVSFEGEISELTSAKSGHLYLKIKDDQSQIDAVMWKGSVAALSFKPERGIHVLCDGKPNVYSGSGRLQMVLSSMVPAGEGALQRKFLELKAKLEKEGLFNPLRKRPIPTFPLAIGVVTSRTGAVIHDIMVRIKERMPFVRVYLVDVRVQGDGASTEIAEGIRLFNEFGKVDVLIVGRGGGSLEDLWAFNEEEVVRAIFASQIPVISSVGHEVDVTLSDFVADLRAPTPTAAAEMAVPKRSDLLTRIADLDNRIADYARWFTPLEQRVDTLQERLESRSAALVGQVYAVLQRAEAQLKLLHPYRILTLFWQRSEVLVERLVRAVLLVSQSKRSTVDALCGRLEALNPYKVLQRGYSFVEKDGHVVSKAAQLDSGDMISITFSEGTAQAKIER